jgi:anaerobic selenocysteine-containing dehydrogenase
MEMNMHTTGATVVHTQYTLVYATGNQHDFGAMAQRLRCLSGHDIIAWD